MHRFALAALVVLFLAGPASAALTPRQLLLRYQPTLVLEPGERFRPTAVEPFLAASELEARSADGSWLAHGPASVLPVADPAGCVSGAGSRCWRLNLRGCTADVGIPSLACYAGLQSPGSAVYARVVTTRSRIVLQYWYLYAFNFWSARNPPSDFIWRSHEGDWELVAVILSKNRQPVQLAVSQHCGGRRRAWTRVRTSARTHPVVYVALGSHANYFAPGQYRHDPSCYPQAANEIFRVNGVVPTDFALDGVPLLASRTTLVSVTSRSPSWMAFPGAWGEPGYFHAPGVNTVSFGAGPEGPAFHRTWTDVAGTILRWPLG